METGTATERAKEELARILGIASGDIKTANGRWLQLMKEGVVVQLHIGRWRAHAAVTAEDLGLEGDMEAASKVLSLGTKRLLPWEYIDKAAAIESTGRKTLTRMGVATYWGTMIPATAFEEWKQANDEQKARYFALRDELVANFDAIRDSVMTDYRKAAEEAYRRQNQLRPEAMSARDIWAEWQYMEPWLDRIANRIPTADQIARDFTWDEEYAYIPLPSLLAEDAAEVERIRAQRDIERAEEELQKDSLWREIELEDAAARERQRKLEAMNREVIERARQQKQEMIDKFMSDLVKQLRSVVYDAVTDILGAIQRNNGKMPARSVVQLKGLFEQVEKLNFFGDMEITRSLNQVRAAFPEDRGNRDVQEIAGKLRDVATIVRASLLDLGSELEKPARELEIADVPTESDLLRSRRNLGLIEDEVIPAELPFVSRRLEAELIAA